VTELLDVEGAAAWLLARIAPLPAEPISTAVACGRVAAAAVLAPEDLPREGRAAIDGYALAAEDTIGAAGYLPLSLTVPGQAVPVAAGAALPRGTDAVLPLERAAPAAGAIEVIDPLAPGDNVVMAGEEARAGDLLVAAGRPLRAADLGLLALAGVPSVAVVRRPVVRLLIARAAMPDTDGPLLAALLARDGALVERPALPAADDCGVALQAALREPGADLLLVAGRTGPAADDHAPAALAAVGRVMIRGIALAGAETACLGLAGEVPALLLPGAPAACLWGYELIAAAAVRRLGGRPAALPYVRRDGRLARKIVSAIGLGEAVPLRRGAEGWMPLAFGGPPSLARAASADGFVLVPAGSEGFAAGSHVPIYRRDEHEEAGDE
jgi:molybdopterin molybdotransferase